MCINIIRTAERMLPGRIAYQVQFKVGPGLYRSRYTFHGHTVTCQIGVPIEAEGNADAGFHVYHTRADARRAAKETKDYCVPETARVVVLKVLVWGPIAEGTFDGRPASTWQNRIILKEMR